MLFQKFKISDNLTNFFAVSAIILIVYFASALRGNPGKIQSSEDAAATITQSELRRDVYVLASDSMEGRKTGSVGQKKAAAFIAGQFKQIGLKPVKIKDEYTYFQQFNLTEWTWGEIYVKGNERIYHNQQDFLYMGTPEKSFETNIQLVYVGYGNEEDYKENAIENKGVLIMNGDDQPDWWGRVKLARKRGVEYVFVLYGKDDKDFSNLNNRLQSYYTSPELTMDQGETAEDKNHLIYLSHKMASGLFNMAPEQFKKIADKRTAGKHTAHEKIPGCVLDLHVERLSRKINTANVMGYIPGNRDPREVVILSAHYDHLGVKDHLIYHGADDNASGTSAIMEIAEAFSLADKSGIGPGRSLLFIAMTGEEEGLFGSRYYVDHPVFPLDETVADFNIDMIGRKDVNHPDSIKYVYVIGSDKLSDELDQILVSNNRKFTELQLDYKYDDERDPNRFYYRSDHYNFARYGIPVIFYFTGVHKDYHKPTDTADKIRYDRMVDISKLIFYTAWEVADQPERLKLK